MRGKLTIDGKPVADVLDFDMVDDVMQHAAEVAKTGEPVTFTGTFQPYDDFILPIANAELSQDGEVLRSGQIYQRADGELVFVWADGWARIEIAPDIDDDLERAMYDEEGFFL